MLLRSLGEYFSFYCDTFGAAARAYRAALGLATNRAERNYLARRLEQVTAESAA